MSGKTDLYMESEFKIVVFFMVDPFQLFLTLDRKNEENASEYN